MLRFILTLVGILLPAAVALLPAAVALLPAAVALLPAAVAAQVPAGTPAVEFGTQRFEIPEGEPTEVLGTLPVDIQGIWLVSEAHEVSKGRIYPLAKLLLITKKAGGGLQVNVLDNSLLPPALLDDLKKAQQERRAWTPSAEELAAAAAAVKQSAPKPNPHTRGKHVLKAAAQFDAMTKEDSGSEGALFAIESIFTPPGRPVYGCSYFVHATPKDKLTGKLVMGALPSDPKKVPLPIGTKGTFEWYRLGPPPSSVAAGATPAAPGAATPAAPGA
jgi:hypothetical protein